MPATNRVIAITTFVALFGIAFVLVHTVLWFLAPAYAPLVIRAQPTQPVLPGVNAASRTTAERKTRTLDNPVGMLNGNTVFLKVDKIPPQ